MKFSGCTGQPGMLTIGRSAGGAEVPAEVVGQPHAAGRVAGHRVDAAVGRAGADRDHAPGLRREPVDPPVQRQRLAGRQVVAERRPIALAVDVLVRDPWHLDPAFRRPGRFDRVIFVPPPDAPARSAILRIQLRDKPATDVDVDQVAAKLDMFSGADLKGLVDLAVEGKLGEAMRTGIPTPLRTKDLLDAARSMTPTTKEWFATARNHVLYANQAGLYDAVRPWLKL